MYFRVFGVLYVDKVVLLVFKVCVDDFRGVFSNWNDLDIIFCNWNGIVCSNVIYFVIFMYVNEI